MAEPILVYLIGLIGFGSIYIFEEILSQTGSNPVAPLWVIVLLIIFWPITCIAICILMIWVAIKYIVKLFKN